MDFDRLAVTDLSLNPHNDRHGTLRDETAAIQWLLDHRDNHMRALAKDLAEQKRLYEYPLVRKEGDKYVVFDGNRRTCCIKLMLNPELAPSGKWRDFFEEFDTAEMSKFFAYIECEIESDLAIIDEILYRRHTGTQEGVGQTQWDPDGKSNFLQRTGKDSVGIGESIEKTLKAERLVPDTANLPWSNLQRLLSSEPIRRRIGISFSGGVLTYLGNKTENLQTLQRIALDATDRKSDRHAGLTEFWNNETKGRYLDRLKSEGYSVDNVKSKGSSEANGSSDSTPPLRIVPTGRKVKQKNLISRADHNPFINHVSCERAEAIWRELQFELEFDVHDNAIAVLVRVLLELAVTEYARSQGIALSLIHI